MPILNVKVSATRSPALTKAIAEMELAFIPGLPDRMTSGGFHDWLLLLRSLLA